jgi:flagellar basal-body rod protein FlgB
LYLFDVASRHMTWLAGRQSVTAVNIANADTPGYRAQDIAPFSAVLDGTTLALETTSSMHMGFGGNAIEAASRRAAATWGSAHSGNDVSIEQELMKAGANSRMMNLDVVITRSFHRMLLSSLKV